MYYVNLIRNKIYLKNNSKPKNSARLIMGKNGRLSPRKIQNFIHKNGEKEVTIKYSVKICSVHMLDI